MRGLAIHGHFYQPPREDPLTGTIPREPGAAPFPHWNARIHHECYRPNARLGNFERISFNMGPTLLAWMESYDTETYRLIVKADQQNVKKYGAGNALAQAYNHTILPLSPLRDRITQIAWGIADFTHRFGRRPEGMWLPETAVDQVTLKEMARQGIRFTILAPWQARAPVSPTRPYRVPLGEGYEMIVFFYHRELSGRVSFDPQTTSNADTFALRDALHAYEDTDSPQLLLIASDGELYGHHKPFRDYFLQHLLHHAAPEAGLFPTYPAYWLRHYPVTNEVHIHDGTSWSCHHGVARWSTGCSCTPGDTSWKKHFYHAMRTLADELDRIFEQCLQPVVHDPWHLRNRYISIRLGRETLEDVLQHEVRTPLDPVLVQRIRYALEAQYERQRMFTSCGWFFEDFDRIEPRNNMAYAARAIWLTYCASGVDLLHRARNLLSTVCSERTGVRGSEILLHTYQRLQSRSCCESAA